MDIDEYYNASYEVKDNFLSFSSFKIIQNAVMGPDFNWNYNYNVTDSSNYENDIYFIHIFYMGLTSKPKLDFHGNPILPEKSPFYKFIEPLIEKLPDFQTLIRAKANLYVARKKLIHHKDHTDMEFSHKGAILYLNDNDGFTVLEDGTEIESKANRLLLFDPSKPHHSTSCTKDKRRVNININYL